MSDNSDPPRGLLGHLKAIARRLSEGTGSKLGYLSGFAVVDFEASSLSDESWPIEAGVAWLTPEGRVQSWSSLIRPADSWPELDWSEEAAAVHGIDRMALQDALPFEQVAEALLHKIAGRRLVADAPDHDRAWMNRLLEAAGHPKQEKLDHFTYLTVTLFRDAAHDAVEAYLADTPKPHRAGPDAERLLRAWLVGLAAEMGDR